MKKETKKQRVYISGPVSGLDYKEVWHRFKTVQRQLQKEGYECFNPCCIQLPVNSTHEQYMNLDLAQMPDCDIVYFLDGWEKSSGCRQEIQMALATGKDIRFEAYGRYRLPLQNPRISWLSQAADAMKISLGDLTGNKRNRYCCNRRLAVIIFLYSEEKLDFGTIGDLLHRDRTCIYQLFKFRLKFFDEVRPLIDVLIRMKKEDACNEEPQPLPLFDNNLNDTEHETVSNQ